MKIQTIVLGAVKTNCYFIINEDTKETIIIDPSDDVNKIIKKVEESNLVPVGILLTHGHFDHIMAVPGVSMHFNIPVYAHIMDRDLAGDAILNGGYLIQSNFTLKLENFLTDGEEISLAGFKIKVIHTPGHTGGSVCYYLYEEGVLISGDTLFYNSVGRTDMPTGDGRVLLHSIEKKLMLLPNETKVYPGHGMSTTIGYERINNPFIHADAMWE